MSRPDYPFNDELLFTEADRELAKRLYPSIYPALNHEELRDIFGEIDKKTNEAKRRSRRWGVTAVVLVTLALLLASTEAWFEPLKWPWRPWIPAAAGILSAALGISGALLGVFGVLFANTKRDWLEGRLLTERMRQFRFQTLAALIPDILDASRSGDWAAFTAKRSILLDKFEREVIARRSSLFTAIVEGEEQDVWLFQPCEPSGPQADIDHELFKAYRYFRIERQIRFTDYKLDSGRRLFSSLPRDQSARLGLAAMVCVMGLVFLHILIGLGAGFGVAQYLYPLHLAAIWFAIAALSIRTLEEGLRPGREVERYRAYRSALRSIARRFNEAATVEARYRAMISLETLTFDEMVNFLKSNNEARFVM
jgi:hypothetical protein